MSRHHLMVILDNIEIIIQKSEKDGKNKKKIKAGEYNPLESSINSVRTDDTNQIVKNRNSLGAGSEDGSLNTEEEHDVKGKKVSPEKGRDHSDTTR